MMSSIELEVVGSALTVSFALLLAGLIFATHMCYSQWQRSRFLSQYPWLGTDGNIFFPRWRARLHNVSNFKAVIQQGYQQYSLRNQTCILPTLADDLILLPPNHMDWIISQPDSVLCSIQPHVDSLQSDHTFPHPRIIRHPIHHQIVKRELSQQLGRLTHNLMDEISCATDALWPLDQARFQDVHTFSTLMRIVARTSNRIFVGAPLCRNDKFLENAAGFAREVPSRAATLKQLPSFLRSLTSRYLLADNQKHIQELTALIRPEVEKRQAALADTEKAGKLIHDDALQWLINRAEEVGGIERDSSVITGRLLALNFAAIHTSSFAITNTLFDLVSSDPKDRYIEQLREEVEQTLADAGGMWTRASLAKMYKMDSALKESLRLGSFLGPGMVRKVMVRSGLTTPNGTFCPYGSKVAIPTTGIHNDPVLYPDTSTYRPFRFSDARRCSANGAQTWRDADHAKKANLGMVSTSSLYHPFGHGRHCCPGRFFAANELKLLLAYILLNYDFEMIAERPKSFWRGTVYLPPVTSSLRVRRR